MFKRFRYSCSIPFLLVLLLILTACSGTSDLPGKTYSGIHLPLHDGKAVLGNDYIHVDVSHIEEGYFAASYEGTSEKVKLQLTGPDTITYTYDMPLDGSYDTFSFSAGSGKYTLMIYECLEGEQYYASFAEELKVNLRDELLPFLYPNQFVQFDEHTQAVAKAKELTSECSDATEMIAAIYNFTINNITYDTEKAATVSPGYLPDVDETLETKKGICFDYASLMTCMLRAIGIPTKLQIGFSGEIKHAWISTYIEGQGWADNIIHFDGTGWAMMDPTFASELGSSEMKNYIGDGTNYTLQYSR